MLRAEDKVDLETAGSFSSLIQPYARQLYDELRTSLAFARQRFGGNYGNRLLLTGGGASLPQIAEFLSQRLDLPVSVVTAEQLIELDKRSNVGSQLPLLASAIGLALYGQEER
jgi:type IV pilus assembly protein PilM